MGKNKWYIFMIVMLAILAIIGSILIYILLDSSNANAEEPPTIDEIIVNSVDIDDITTNLLDHGFIRVSFKVETDGKDAKKELEKRDFQVRNIMIQELSEMKAEQFDGKQGKIALQDKLLTQMNEIMQDGTIQNVYITSFLLQ
ncbi:flagellar basal body-associated protein FliL [Cytobacillus sp. IB215665]|uniref:flagellar basal body-associated protein FliL n=1 Tax=Cytobacillus sp. IB215665 TaxID=3097357 RepID=UPI002A1801AB|nr:flagellar basal body-associated protein FliL [Cytobacillus sp. IB215665]MDX8365072.1 flagellar basal body-associated protein FliL [Cytobacillus sp. IB215665]